MLTSQSPSPLGSSRFFSFNPPPATSVGIREEVTTVGSGEDRRVIVVQYTVVFNRDTNIRTEEVARARSFTESEWAAELRRRAKDSNNPFTRVLDEIKRIPDNIGDAGQSAIDTVGDWMEQVREEVQKIPGNVLGWTWELLKALKLHYVVYALAAYLTLRLLLALRK